MTVYKVLNTTAKFNIFRSGIVVDEYQLLYKIDKTTKTLPNTPGIAAFDTLYAAKRFILCNYFGDTPWRIFKAIARVRLSSVATAKEVTCRIQLNGYLRDKRNSCNWPTGTVLCDTLTIQTQIPFDTPGVLS